MIKNIKLLLSGFAENARLEKALTDAVQLARKKDAQIQSLTRQICDLSTQQEQDRHAAKTTYEMQRLRHEQEINRLVREMAEIRTSLDEVIIENQRWYLRNVAPPKAD